MLQRAMTYYAQEPFLGIPSVNGVLSAALPTGLLTSSAAGAGAGAGAGAADAGAPPVRAAVKLRRSNSESVEADMLADLKAELGMNDNDVAIDYTWLTYQQVGQLAGHVANELLELLPAGAVPPSVVGICGGNRYEWVATDFACCFADFATVGLHTAWPDDEIAHIIGNAGINAVVCASDQAAKFVSASKGRLKAIVVMDSLAACGVTPAEAEAAGITMHEWHAIVAKRAAAGPPETPWTRVATQDDAAMFTLIYGSGTSGIPKAVMTSKGRWKRDATGGLVWQLPNKVVVPKLCLKAS